jgi:hypothetical protein
MKVGVTGTRSGMTESQYDAVKFWLKSLDAKELHHGDCVGVDVEVAILAASLGYYIVNHPPIKDDLRAYHHSHQHRDPLSYFARNRNIVDECDILMVVPHQMERQPNGGTWYTHDYAVKKQKHLIIFYPDGSTSTRI